MHAATETSIPALHGSLWTSRQTMIVAIRALVIIRKQSHSYPTSNVQNVKMMVMVMAAALQKAKEAVKKERQLEKLHQQLQKGTPRNDGLAFSTCLQLALMHEAAGLPNEALRIYQALLKNKASPQVSLPDPSIEYHQQQVASPQPRLGLMHPLCLQISGAMSAEGTFVLRTALHATKWNVQGQQASSPGLLVNSGPTS